MADKHFRVIVDLSAFFYDHRRLARIFVRSNLKKISDLQSRISEIFEISDFYLTTGGQFLPASEDIRVLNNNESICAIPNKPQEAAGSLNTKVSSSTQQKEQKRQKRSLEVIPEDSGETSTPKKKKSKKKHVEVISFSSCSSEDEIPKKEKKSENRESTKSNKKKSNHKIEGADSEHFANSNENKKAQSKKVDQSIVEREICNIESSQKIIDIKRKLKQKTDEYVNKHSKITSCYSMNGSPKIKNILPKLQSHIKNCNDLGRSTLPDTVRLSRHVDTPIKAFKQYTPPPRITDKYLAKNKINIVKIDIVKEGNNDMISSDNAVGTSNEHLENYSFPENNEGSCSSQKNYVKEVINSFEKNISPESKKSIVDEKEINGTNEEVLEVKESQASNYTKAFLDQRDTTTSNTSECRTDISVNLSVKSVDNAPVPNTTINGLEDFNSLNSEQSVKMVDAPTIKPLNEAAESANVSMDISSIAHDSSYLSGISKDSSRNSTNLNNSSVILRNTTSNKRFMGVGTLIERLRESDSVISHESDTSSHTNVTKRKRNRKHKRKKKKSDEDQKAVPVKVETYVANPISTKACPSIHIKFEDNYMGPLDDKSLMITDMSNETVEENLTENKIEIPKGEHETQTLDTNKNKSIMLKTMVINDEYDDSLMENKSIFFGDEIISKAPLMTDKLEPKVGDVIAFKVLKMTENYTPQVSNYIVGKLELYLLENKTVYFKILYGEEELLPPLGKLSLKEADINLESPKYREFLWTDLITPKLLYP